MQRTATTSVAWNNRNLFWGSEVQNQGGSRNMLPPKSLRVRDSSGGSQHPLVCGYITPISVPAFIGPPSLVCSHFFLLCLLYGQLATGFRVNQISQGKLTTRCTCKNTFQISSYSWLQGNLSFVGQSFTHYRYILSPWIAFVCFLPGYCQYVGKKNSWLYEGLFVPAWALFRFYFFKWCLAFLERWSHHLHKW